MAGVWTTICQSGESTATASASDCRGSSATFQPKNRSEALFDIPTNELTDILRKRRAVFFPDDNRLIERYRVIIGSEDFTIYVAFAEPSRKP